MLLKCQNHFLSFLKENHYAFFKLTILYLFIYFYVGTVKDLFYRVQGVGYFSLYLDVTLPGLFL